MKGYMIIIGIATSMLAGCTTNKLASVSDDERGEISWNAFCASRGYDRSDNTFPIVNEYLDTWCGSTEEEKALVNEGVEPH